VQDAGFGSAFSLFMRTLPYALARFGVLAVVSFVSIVWTVLTFGGFAFLATRLHPFAGYAWLFAGLAAYGAIWRSMVRYTLYLLKAGHIAVLTELITRGSLELKGEDMFAYGKRVVTERFGQVNAMFALDLLVSGVVRAFNRSLTWLSNLLPIPGLQGIMGVVKAIVYSATTFIDETIFSYSLARGDSDNFRSSRDGLIYYAQNSREVLKTGVLVVIVDKIATVITWVAMLVPAFMVTAILPAAVKGSGGFFTFLFAAFFAWNARAAFLEPLCLTMIMLRFHVCVRDQPIDVEWDGRLSTVSKQFVELKSRITGAAGVTTEPAQSALLGP
jgi:hypothetical protein